MDQQEAASLLGVANDADEPAVEKAFRRASKRFHPDGPEGDRELWERVLEARDLLLGKPSAAMVPLSLALELAGAQEKALARFTDRQEKAVTATRTQTAIVRRHTSRLDQRKRTAWAMGIASGGVALLITLLRAVVLTDPTGEADGMITTLIVALGLTPVVLGLMGLHARAQAEKLEHAVEDVAAQLSQRPEFLQVLNEIMRVAEANPPWSPEAFDRIVERWSETLSPIDQSSLAWTASEVGGRDFSRLLLAKGLEHGFLTERTEGRDGEMAISYDLAQIED